jgi:hypothetical protein
MSDEEKRNLVVDYANARRSFYPIEFMCGLCSLASKTPEKKDERPSRM